MNHLKAEIEGLLFVVGDEGISETSIAETLGIALADVQQTIFDLENFYRSQQSAFTIIRVAGVLKLSTISEIYPVLTRYMSLKSTRSLSQSALETLAIIAYKQPITRSEIETLRGVSSELMLKKLQAMDLISVEGRAETPGRPLKPATEEIPTSCPLFLGIITFNAASKAYITPKRLTCTI